MDAVVRTGPGRSQKPKLLGGPGAQALGLSSTAFPGASVGG